MYTKILIPLDGSKTAEKVLPYARLFAGRLKCPVELLGIFDMPEMVTHIGADKVQDVNTLIEKEMRGSEFYLEEIAKTFAGPGVKYRVEKGEPAEVIIARAAIDKGTLITMATHGHSGVKRWLLGSVAEKVLRAAKNPVLLVRATEGGASEGEATLKSILVPLDGSGLAETVLPTVTEIAKSLAAQVILTRAYQLPASSYYRSADYIESKSLLPTHEELSAEIGKEARIYLEHKVESLRLGGTKEVDYLLLEGNPADEIITLAQQTRDNLIAMCTHGRSGIKRWVLGSVTEKVVRHSGDPVLVLRSASQLQ